MSSLPTRLSSPSVFRTAVATTALPSRSRGRRTARMGATKGRTSRRAMLIRWPSRRALCSLLRDSVEYWSSVSRCTSVFRRAGST